MGLYFKSCILLSAVSLFSFPTDTTRLKNVFIDINYVRNDYRLSNDKISFDDTSFYIGDPNYMYKNASGHVIILDANMKYWQSVLNNSKIIDSTAIGYFPLCACTEISVLFINVNNDTSKMQFDINDFSKANYSFQGHVFEIEFHKKDRVTVVQKLNNIGFYVFNNFWHKIGEAKKE